ncbi:hypothetical protein EJB05_09229, partial [Eragrostis curvula]
MAETVSSAVVQETVNRILSAVVKKYEEKDETCANTNLERLEMAHIKLEAALETSSKWQITDASLLRWRKKLKCAARECNDVLHKCKQRIHEDEQIKQEVKNTPFANRIAHATKSFVFSVFSGNNNGLSRSTIERFEWFANGASILPANKSSAAVAVVGEDQYCFHKDITLEQLKEIMLPKAVDYFRENANATVYQMSWKSEHGSAVIHFEKANMNTRSILKGAQRTFGGAKKRKLWQGRDEERRSRRAMLPDVFHLWGAHMGVKLQSFFMDWMQKEKEEVHNFTHKMVISSSVDD